MRFIPLEEASKKPEQLTFVPLEEASKTTAPVQFVPLGQATPTSVPAAPPQAAAPEEEKSSLWEFPKALVRGAYDLKGMYAGLQQRGAALGMETPQAAMDVFNKIDAGEIKSKADLSKLIGEERRLPTAEEMVQGDSRLGSKVRTFNLARDYLNATPEERKTLRAQMQGDIQQGGKDLASAVALGEQVKKEAAPYEARVKSGTEVISNLFDIKNFNDAVNFVGDAGSYLASTSGQAIPQMVPMVGAALLTRGKAAAPAAVGAGMELGAGTQNRVDFISDKIKDETDPSKRIDRIGKYIQDTSDVTVTAAIMNGALDAVLGPEKDIAKAIAAQSLKDMTRKEIAKQIPKAVAKSGAKEFFTGGMQETVQINAERTLGEQTGDAFTKENIKRVVDSAMAEAIGGATVTTGFEAVRAATAQKDVSKLDTPEGRALRDLDTLAEEEEEAAGPRRPADLTPQEVSNIERRLYAELGRAPNDYEFEEAVDDYLDEQNAGGGVEPGAGIAGVSDISEPEAAGVPDTTIPTAPESGRLGVAGGAAEVTGVGDGTQLGALEEKPVAEGEPIFTWQNFPVLIAGEPFTDQYGNTQQRVLFPNALGTFEGEGARYDFVPVNELEQRGEYSSDPEISKLQMQERSAFGDYKSIETEQKELLNKAGRKPAKNSPARKRYDELEQQRVQAYWDWVASEDRLSKASERASPKAEEVITEKPKAETPASVESIAATYADQLFAANPDYGVADFDNAESDLFSDLIGKGITGTESRKLATKAFEERLNALEENRGKPPAPASAKPTFALPDEYAHGTDYLTAQNIIRNGRLIPDAGKRMYSYSQFGRKAVYLTARDGWWLDADKAANGRAAVYDASVPFKLDPKANIREVNTPAELDAIAREIGEPDGATMMRKLSVENLDYEAHVRETKGMSFDEYVVHEVKDRRERLKQYGDRDADSVVDVDSWAAQEKAEEDRSGRSAIFGREPLEKIKARISNRLRGAYNDVQTYDEQYKDADEVTQKLLDTGIDGIYVGPDFGAVNPEEYKAFDALWDRMQDAMPEASPEEVFAAAKEEYKKINPTYFDRASDVVASDQLALFRPELAVVDRARLAATRPAPAQKPALSVEEFKKKPGETEDQYVDRVSKSTGSEMAPNIVEMLRNNDLNGALREVANILPGFYGTLANRLAQLDMPTGVRIGDQRNLTRRGIDNDSARQQIRLFGYLRNAAPDFFNKYFNQYDRVENLELVYEGLTKLPNFVSDTKLGPVRTEYETVLQAFENNMPGLTALGAYYPVFDEINLNDQTRAYGTGMRRELGLSYRTFLHESVHAATELLLLTPRDQRTTEQNAAVDELERLYEYAIGKISGKRYGFTNLSEFIAEVMTNRSFQNELKAIPYPAAKTNIFTQFVQAIMKLVGLDNVAGRAMVEAERLFNVERPYQVLSAGPRFAQAPKKRRVRGPISQPDTYRTAETQQNTLNQTLKDAYEGRMPWSDAIKILGPSLWDSGNTQLRKTVLPVMNLTHLEDLTRTKFTQITGALKIIRDMLAYRAKKMNTASEIMRDWTKAQKENFAQSQLMGRIMMEATIRGIDPDKAAAGALNKPLQDAWNTLKPEFKAIYRRVRDFYANSVNEMVREAERRASAIQDRVERDKALQKIKEQFGPDKLVKPYFPLRRFGQYYYQVGSGNFKEFYEFENPLTRDLAMRRRAQELLKGNKQQRDLARTMTKGNGISELYGRNISTTQALKDVQDLVDNITATDTADLKDQLKDSLNQLIYILLPQQSVRKMFINRKAIQGASADMLRVFATTAVHSAYQQSRFMYSEKFLQNLNNARSEIDDAQKTGMLSTDTAAVYRDFIFEVEQRVPTIMSNEDTSMTAQIAGKASELTFYYMLSAPFTAMLNTIGAVQLAMPYIGGSYGYVRANALLAKNMGRYLGTTPTRTFAPLAKGDFAQVNFPSIAEGGKLPPLLQKAADRFIDDGVIDISLTNDIFELGERPSALYTGTSATIKKVMSGLFHQSERMNREIVLLTTFELAYDKFLKDYQRQPGMEGLRGVYLRDAQNNKIKNTPDQAFELAIEEAIRVASISLGDYSRQMKGRIFANPVMNLLLKFKQYPILAMYALQRNFHVGMVAPFKKAELDQYRELLEKELQNDPNKDQVIAQRLEEVEAQRKALEKEGRRRLAGILGVTTILGGVTASPLFSLVVGPLVKMFAGDDDDDDYFNWEIWFYNYMETEFGGYAGAMLANAGVKPETAEKLGPKVGVAVSRGLPAAMGAAVADRVSLDPKALLWRDGRYSPDARENFIESLIANAGPVVGLGLNFVDAYQLVKEGQYARAVEKAVPAIIAKPASAVRMGIEGAKTKKGDVLIDDFTATELAMQSIGLQPERLAIKQKRGIAMKEKEQKILDERKAIMDRLWMERDNESGFEAALERAIEFNGKRKNPNMLITAEKIQESFEKRAKLKAEAEAFGANIDKRLRGEIVDMGGPSED
jgi:hypothetical protein